MLKGHKHSDLPAAAPSLFKGTVSSHDYKVPLLEQSSLERAFDEIELLGFPLADPFLLADEPLDQGTTAAELQEKLGHFVIAYGYLVTVKDTKTQKGDRMNFATFVDQNGDFLDSVHFPNIAAHSGSHSYDFDVSGQIFVLTSAHHLHLLLRAALPNGSRRLLPRPQPLQEHGSDRVRQVSAPDRDQR